MNICVLSGRYPATEFASAENHRVYCDRHQYHYIHCNWPTKAENLYLNKFHYIRHYYDLFDYIFWLDDDAFILDQQQSLNDFLPGPGKILSICKSPANKQLKTVFSSGSFMLACSKHGKEFVDAVIATDLEKVKEWWRDEFGYFTNGDQDIMVYLYSTVETFRNGITLMDYMSFNSRVEDVEVGQVPFLLHLTGTPDQKRRKLKSLKHLLGLNSSLLEKNNINGFRLVNSSGFFLQLKRIYWRANNMFRVLKKRVVGKFSTQKNNINTSEKKRRLS